MSSVTRRDILLIILSFLIISIIKSTTFSTFWPERTTREERVLLVTSHPDDETLFFSPTLLGLQKQKKPSIQLFSACLSTGNADGLGEVRRREFGDALDVLGIEPGRRMLVDHPELQDNITQHWNSQIIANELRDFVVEHGITLIMAFDEEGISSHPNHISTFEGVKYLVFDAWPSNSMASPPKIFKLVSHPLSTKYIGIVAPFLSRSPRLAHKLNLQHTEGPVFLSGIGDYITAITAMRRHASQLVWFRYLNVMFSRYMWVNEWVEVKVQHTTTTAFQS
ncbi:putative deacetylase LmbE-like domain-containing protein [Flagelloscypha sp. PMI_526]|nr:putative deacetylase LmbE-like domain-containing protein [Flagelloscypha sp. PMI_526]